MPLAKKPEGVWAMSERIPDSVVEAIRSKVNIVDVIGDYVELSKAGKNYKGLCPFHGEKTPSFNVNPESQYYHCFGCHAGGDVFKFIMEREAIDFTEAVRRLGSRVGITVDLRPLNPNEQAEAKKKRRLAEIHTVAQRFFAEALFIPEAATARAYLRRRGITKPMVDLFGLGYSPASWETLYRALKDQGFSDRECIESGLVIESSRGEGAYDRFRGRLMFTICDEHGRPMAFGGRVLDDSQPKYLNSPETPLFRKGTHVYGLHVARDGILTSGKAIVVEGYTDVIGLYQHGITNVVASLGTAFTEEQARLLRKHCQEIIVAFDGDAAGEAATWRSMDLLAKQGFAVSVVTIPGGNDPDSFVRSRGSEAAKQLFSQAEPLVEFKIKSAFLAADPRTIQGKVAIVESVTPILSNIDGALERSEYLRKVARQLGVEPSVVQAEVRRFEEKTGKLSRTRNNTTQRRKNRTRPVFSQARAEQNPLEDSVIWLEKVVLHGVLSDWSRFSQAYSALGDAGFEDALHQRLWRNLCQLAEEGKLAGVPNRIERVNDGALEALIDDLNRSAPRLIPGQSFDSCLQRLKEFRLRQDVRDLAARAGSLGDAGGSGATAISQLKTLLVRYKELKDEIDRVCMY